MGQGRVSVVDLLILQEKSGSELRSSPHLLGSINIYPGPNIILGQTSWPDQCVPYLKDLVLSPWSSLTLYPLVQQTLIYLCSSIFNIFMIYDVLSIPYFLLSFRS